MRPFRSEDDKADAVLLYRTVMKLVPRIETVIDTASRNDDALDVLNQLLELLRSSPLYICAR